MCCQSFAQNNEFKPTRSINTANLDAADQDDNRSDNSESVNAQPSTTEILRAKPPADWKLAYQVNNDETRFADFIPAEEDNDNWRTKLSIESHQNLDGVDPISAILGEVENTSEVCTNFNHFNLFSGVENGYPTSVRLIECGENAHNSKGEISIIKAIQGNDYFYFVRLSRRTEPFSDATQAMEKAEIAAWSAYLKDINACDTKNTYHPCQPANKN